MMHGSRFLMISLLFTACAAVTGCKSEDANVVSETKPCVGCSKCGTSREVTSEELGKLFPVQGLSTKLVSAKCDKCGQMTLRPAFRCPRDGTLTVQRETGELMFEPCAKCGWTPASAARNKTASGSAG